MMKMKSLLIGLTITASIAIAFYFHAIKNLSLTAKSMVPVFETEADAIASPSPKTITELLPQQSVEIVRCVDVKHYLIYKVRLPDGRVGFVNMGDYIIMRDGKPSFC